MLTRRNLLQNLTAAAVAASPAPPVLKGNRFLTLATVVRVNQIEVSRDRNLGLDEAADHTPENVAAFRAAVESGWPGARITWALSWCALQDRRKNYEAIRELVAGFHVRHGDEVTFIPGGYFANAYNTREQVNRDLHDGLAMASAVVGRGYRPRTVVAGFLAADNLRYLAEHEGIHVCQGNIWSQYAVDNQDGDGSICYPYYPSREHFCKPSRNRGDFIDCVNLDGWTMDFLAARRAGFARGFNSRMGVGPIETIRAFGPEKGLRQIMETTATHFDGGFALNGFAWVTNIWEICLIEEFRRKRGWTGMESLTMWLRETRKRWPRALCLTHGEFGSIWRRQCRDNRRLDYRFVARGTGIGGSDADKQIRWFMNRDFRLALLRQLDGDPAEQVIDLTRYDLPAQEPRDMTRRWSLLGRINQKNVRPQDAPVPLRSLSGEELAIIRRHYPELAG
jgi:hypothetical protein